MVLNPKHEIHRGEVISSRGRSLRTMCAVGPGLTWMVIFFAVPLTLIAAVSFLSRGEFGTIERPLTFENYWRLAGWGLLGFDSLYPIIVFRSLVLAGGTALLCLIAGLPMAFFIARLSRPYKTLALNLVVIPFWTNLLIRTYAWQMLLGPESWISRMMVGLGLGPSGEAIYPGTFAVYLCMVCDFLPFMILPLYASAEKIDWSMVEAAMDLGANHLGVFRHGILPQIKPGLAAGFVLVFLPATGQFVIPDLMGGAKTVMLGNAIQQQFGPGLDWPFGAAIAVISLALVAMGLWIFARQSAGENVEIF